MEFLHIFLLLVSLSLVIADDSCPSASEISPCTCDGEGLNCMSAKTTEEIRKAFRANYKYSGVRAIWIQGTPITDIPGDLFGKVKSQQIYIEMNNISSVDLNAFLASNKTVTTLSLFGNKLNKLDYSKIMQYESLSVLNIGRNKITSIPDQAFKSNSISEILLDQNQITHIGKYAFSGVPLLKKLTITYNKLQILGPYSLSSKVHSPSLVIGLSGNQISNIANTAFQDTAPYAVYFEQNRLTSLPSNPFTSLITKIGQKGGFMAVAGNPFSCKGCDYSWIVMNKAILNAKLVGFRCVDGRSIGQLSNYNIQCN